MDYPSRSVRAGLATIGGFSVGYCMLVLATIATSPDLRLRFLLVDSPLGVSSTNTTGIEIQKMPGLICDGPLPSPGDRLVSLDGQPINNFLAFSRLQLSIRNREISSGGILPEGANLLASALPSLVQDDRGARWVRSEFVRDQSGERMTCRVKLQSVPPSEVIVTLVWFLLQLVIFSVGAVAFWNRPFDVAARRFFVMCVATLGAFVGGFHWQAISGSFWLTLPFAVSGILLPAVTLHFFLVYPRPKPILTRWPHAVRWAIYGLPIAAILGFLYIEGLLWALSVTSSASLVFLGWLRYGVYAYLTIAAAYFLVTLVALGHSWLTTRNPVELSQVRWILCAGFAASICIGYALFMAMFSRVDFALGGARIPMFLASLVFMVAYAIGIVRYKLMLVDQILSKGMWYYVLSYGATATVGFGVAIGSLAVAVRKTPAAEQQTWLIAGILMLVVVLLIWVRDSWQRFIDRRFFREKYQLDKALQGMQREVGRLTDVQYLSERMSLSCRDVLQSSRVGLYLSDGRPNGFRLTAADGASANLPIQLLVPAEFSQALAADSTLQWVTPASRDNLSPVQTVMRQLQADLVQALEVDGRLSGLVVLGSKQDGSMYSAEDLTFLTALAQITGIALHSAKVHQDITELNVDIRLKSELIARQKQQIAILQAELATAAPANPEATQATTFRREAIIGHSPALEGIMDTVRKVAASETSVLLRGESGTGKELLAKAIHDNSARRDGPMIAVHCASLSAGLLESELFGHVKGAFTGAQTDRQGRFELANGGTLFLDEIGDISPETQVKLLRVSQQREFERVGGTETIRVDVRLVAATHQNLERLISEGKFREDLYYRLNVISVTLPPLRERTDDIIELAIFFLRKAAGRAGKQITEFADNTFDVLTRYSWPGNIRELQNVIERAVVLAEGTAITLADLPPDLQDERHWSQRRLTAPHRPATEPERSSQRLGSVIPAQDDPSAERRALIDALEQCNGNKAEAARKLGMARSTYFSKLKKHGLAEAPNRPGRIPRLPR
jgi:formate hydrogenlyase transcriptional activator